MYYYKIIVWNLKKLKLEIVNFIFYLREINFKVRIYIGKMNFNLSLINLKNIVWNFNKNILKFEILI